VEGTGGDCPGKMLDLLVKGVGPDKRKKSRCKGKDLGNMDQVERRRGVCTRP